MKHKYDDSTINGRYRHLISNPIIKYTEEQGNDNKFWSSSIEFSYDSDIESALLLIKKSFSQNEIKILKGTLLNEDTRYMDGQRFGLELLYFTGMRNSEVCGLNYGDIMENEKYNICHSVRVYKTTLVKSSHLKAGGKTSNTPRVEPLHPEIYKRIMERKTYIESIVSFPLYDKESKKYETINSLPIVCVDNNYAEKCNGFILTETGRNFLRNEMCIARNRYNGISELLLSIIT